MGLSGSGLGSVIDKMRKVSKYVNSSEKAKFFTNIRTFGNNALKGLIRHQRVYFGHALPYHDMESCDGISVWTCDFMLISSHDLIS